MSDKPSVMTFAEYAESGEPISTSIVELNNTEKLTAPVTYFTDRFEHLSGDWDLPLEFPMLEADPSIVIRITSDLQNSFTCFYCDDQVVAISLTLIGSDESGSEANMIDSIRLLLLDGSDEDELDDERIDQILSSDGFQFGTIVDRPLHCFVPLQPRGIKLAWNKLLDQLRICNRQLAIALHTRSVDQK